MGGCRCIFQTCANSSASTPGKHFFRFPYKEPERMQKWLKYSKAGWIEQLHISQIKNKVICEDHFRDEYFMNYLKEKLVAKAVPTLKRLSGRKVLDYETGDDPKPTILPLPTLKHLIPPSEVTDAKAEVQVEEQTIDEILFETLEEIPAVEDFEEEVVSPQASPPMPQIQREVREYKRPLRVTSAPAPRILNKKVKLSEESQSKPSTSISLLNPNRVIIDATSPNINSMQFILTGDDFEENILEPMSDELDDELRPEYELMMEAEVPLEEEEPEEPAPPTVSQEEYDKTVGDLCDKIRVLEEQLEHQKAEAALARTKAAEDMEALKKSLRTQVEAVSTSKAAPPPSAGSLTKAQLYNGVKRYLCPSMATLVRMEMFGGPERAWKPDEQQLSVDLLKLGENVFAHFRDEWRVRMPPKKDVTLWLSAASEIDDEEDL